MFNSRVKRLLDSAEELATMVEIRMKAGDGGIAINDVQDRGIAASAVATAAQVKLRIAEILLEYGGKE